MIPARLLKAAAPLLLLVVVGACDEGGAAAPAPDPVRPVLSTAVKRGGSLAASFTGTVEPRFSRELAFRVVGRVVSRRVDVGDAVKAGQLLAELDAAAFLLTVRSREGDVVSASADLDNARSARDRQRALVGRGVNPQAQLDGAEQALAAAESRLRGAKAALDKAREQLSHTRLVAPTDGIVVATGAEAGQTATSAGAVVTLAETRPLEVVFDAPPEFVRDLKAGAPFAVALQVDPSVTGAATLREIGPQADAATRTQRLKATLVDPPAAMRIGTTLAVMRAAEPEVFEVPPEAVVEAAGEASVWVVDERAMTVARRRIDVVARERGRVVVARGLAEGETVIVAGVNSLTEGQKVRLAQELPF